MADPSKRASLHAGFRTPGFSEGLESSDELSEDIFGLGLEQAKQMAYLLKLKLCTRVPNLYFESPDSTEEV